MMRKEISEKALRLGSIVIARKRSRVEDFTRV
jgi:hypothetical protein